MKPFRLSLIIICACLSVLGFSQNEKDRPAPVPEPAVEAQAPQKAFRGQRQGRYGFYTSTEWIIPNIYDELPKKYSNFMIAKKNNKYGIINKLNEEILPFEYKSIRPVYVDYKAKITTGYYIIETGKLKGAIDQKGKIVIPAIYPYFQQMGAEGYVVGDANGHYGLLAPDGKSLFPLNLESKPASAHNNHFIFKKEGKYGVLSRKGKTIIPFKYESLKFYNYGENSDDKFYVARMGEKAGMINTEEKQIIPFEYDDIRNTSYRGLLSVKKDQLMGVLDRKGKVLLPIKYDNFKQYSDNFYLVQRDNKHGLVNRTGKEVIPIEYDNIERKSLRYLVAYKTWKRGVLDTLGNVVLDFNYRKLRFSADKLIFAAKEGEALMGVYNEKGEQLIAPSYYEAERAYHYSIVWKTQSGKRALFDNASLTELTPFQYDRIKVKKDRRNEGQFIISGWRDGVKVEIGVDGREVGGPKISRAAIERELEAKKKAMLDKTLGDDKWLNLISIKGEQYLEELYFLNSENGIRRIYFFKDDKKCFIEQTFKLINTEGNKYYLKITSYPANPACGLSAPAGFMRSSEVMALKTIHIYVDYDKKLSIRNYEKRGKYTKLDIEALKEFRQLKVIAQNLAAKIESRPGGLKNPYLTIDPKSKEIKIHSQYGSIDNIAFLEFNDTQAILKTEFWEKDAYYSLAGIWRNVTYIDQNGLKKTGDLDICFVATKPQKYWLRETGK